METINKNVKIAIKQSAIEFWKPKMEISDFYIANRLPQYSINRIVSQDISNTSTKSSITIEYYDAIDNDVKTETSNFNFKKNKKISLQNILDKKGFKFNRKKLKTLNFINFNKNDVLVYKSNLRIQDLHIKHWSIFDKIIIFELNLLIHNELNHTIIIEKKLNVDPILLIEKLLICDSENSFLKLNHHLEFEVEKFFPIIKGYEIFFDKSEYKRLTKIIDLVEVVDPKILTRNIDIFSKKSIAHFSSSIVIDNHYVKNFTFKSNYNAEYLQKFIITKLSELQLQKNILGKPRTKNIKLKDLYANYKQVYSNSLLRNIGINEFLDNNTIIKILNYNFEKNNADLKIFLKYNDKPIFEKKVIFSETLIEFTSNKILENKLIVLKDSTILNKYPLSNLDTNDFTIRINKKLKILSVKFIRNTTIQSKWIQYKFQLYFCNEKDTINFDYNQDFYFAYSKIEYLFKILKTENLDLTYFNNKGDKYYYNLVANLSTNQKLVSLFDNNELKHIVVDKNFIGTDFEITKMQFNKNCIFDKQMNVFITVISKILRNSKVLKHSIKIKNQELLNEFKLLSSKDIEIIDNKLLKSYPMPFLDVWDFCIKKPFSILELLSKYNDDNSSISGLFVIQFGDRRKVIKKDFYFANNAKKEIQIDNNQNNLKEFKKLNKTNINIEYDKNHLNYFIKPHVEIKLLNKSFYAKIKNWTLKSRFRKLINLKIEINYLNKKKYIAKNIKYKNKISRENFKAWKEANYASK